MRAHVKYPALIVALPQRHKNPKLSLALFDTSVDIPEVGAEDMPMAITCETSSSTLEWRVCGGRLYRDSGLTFERLLKRHAENLLSARDHSRITGPIMRQMKRDIEHIDDYADDTFWPAGLKRFMSAGLQPEYPEFKQIIGESAVLRLDGPWLDAASGNKKLAPFLSERTDDRIARYEKMTRDVFSSMRILEGAVWMEAPEPCYVAQTMPEGYGRCMASDFGFHAVTKDNDEDRRSWWNHLSDRAVSVLERDHLLENMVVPDDRLPKFTVHSSDALNVDIPAVELDRCARVLVNLMSENAARSSKDFSLPSTATLDAYGSLNGFVRSYDPKDGIPDALEHRVRALLEAVDACPSDHHLVPERDRRFAAGFLERWEDRAVSFDMTAGLRA